ncbi:hypothetical protein PAPHI01_0145 [Pancytospora philotis]|nr:hypothetical protein PAPHI01_0145 [Pancytospora philotis]
MDEEGAFRTGQEYSSFAEGPKHASGGDGSAVREHASAAVFMALVLLCVVRRSFRDGICRASLLKRRVCIFGAWMLKIAIFFALLSKICLALLSLRHSMPVHNIEELKDLSFSDFRSIGGYQVDVAAVMTYTLKVAGILLLSSLFFGVAALAPDAEEHAAGAESSDNACEGSSLATLSIFWAILRIPLHLYLDAYRHVLSPQLAAFAFNSLALAELLVAGVCMLLVSAQRPAGTPKPASPDTLWISLGVIVYGVLRHGSSLVDVPAGVSALQLGLLASLQLALELGVYLRMAAVFCFQPSASADAQQHRERAVRLENTCRESDPEVILMPPLVEFGNRLIALK